MNKYFTGTIIAAFLVAGIVIPVYSQDASPSGAIDKEVDKIKEKVAETVAGLASDKKAVAGYVQSIEAGDLILDLDGKKTSVSYDDTLTKVYDAGANFKEGALDDVAKNDYVFVSGPEIDGVVTANNMYFDQAYHIFSGKISQVNADDYSIEVVTLEKDTLTFDIETNSNQEMLDIDTLELSTIGFSKLKEGDSIHVVVKRSADDEQSTRFSAQKVLVIPNEYFLQ
ncbi:hypothetical protein KC726_00725 [Candidatus Woesebacteria bacterium]|nr:hypothetical protein [Candidatus Woesebacteria bacterium]